MIASLSMSPLVKFLFEDSSSSDDSDIDDLILDDDVENIIFMLAMKELEEEEIEEKKRKHVGSKVGRLCLPRNRALGHEMVMKDYFAETDLAHIQKKKEEQKALKELKAKASQKGALGGSGLKKSGKK